jgi:ADP-ribose pyrophosphatase YjhB (NUDIX family)
MGKKNSHCSYCGAAFPEDARWPRRCNHCENTSFVNPMPVAVVLLPVDEGIVVVRRAIEPRKGEIALPGGFIDLGESWQAAAARELREEAGIATEAAKICVFDVLSAPDGTLLVFGLAERMTRADLPPFVPTSETSERIVLNEPTKLAFPLHTQALAAYFDMPQG